MDTPTDNVDSIYYRDAGRIGLARRLSAHARQATYSGFRRSVQPSPATRILDIGVSDEEGPETNMLEQLHPWGSAITAVGLGAGDEFMRRYPESAYVQIQPDARLPFPDKTFDVVWSNAVLEHVGGLDQRSSFIKEAARIANRLYFIVPNRWFPIEHHTAIPLLHWNAGLFRSILRNTSKSHWSDSRNMDLLSKGSLTLEWPLPQRPRISYSGLNLGPWSSNLIIECDLR